MQAVNELLWGWGGWTLAAACLGVGVSLLGDWQGGNCLRQWVVWCPLMEGVHIATWGRMQKWEATLSRRIQRHGAEETQACFQVSNGCVGKLPNRVRLLAR